MAFASARRVVAAEPRCGAGLVGLQSLSAATVSLTRALGRHYRCPALVLGQLGADPSGDAACCMHRDRRTNVGHPSAPGRIGDSRVSRTQRFRERAYRDKIVTLWRRGTFQKANDSLAPHFVVDNPRSPLDTSRRWEVHRNDGAASYMLCRDSYHATISGVLSTHHRGR